MPPENLEIMKSLESWVSKNVLPLRMPVEKWPEQFKEEDRAIRQQVLGLSDEYFVMFVGNMLTENALPTYQTAINTIDGVHDQTGSSSCPWTIWTRA
ncbi:hypothetical protein H5410_032392 [Solanum commersonii]|uniref:Uncharacterized protein n=1 Tax=Solanum commersonii TaxID=4109 RepID=A0A9J5YQ71_SOLCO|nr:hypothetical protein H5410_032392 [Solanum commersonii]